MTTIELRSRPLPPTEVPADYDDRDPLRRIYLTRPDATPDELTLNVWEQMLQAYFRLPAKPAKPPRDEEIPWGVEALAAGHAEMGVLAHFFAGVAAGEPDTPRGTGAARLATRLEQLAAALAKVRGQQAPPPPAPNDLGPLRATWHTTMSAHDSEAFQAVLKLLYDGLASAPCAPGKSGEESFGAKLAAGLEDLRFLQMWFAEAGAERGKVALDEEERYLAEVATEVEGHLREAADELAGLLDGSRVAVAAAARG